MALCVGEIFTVFMDDSILFNNNHKMHFFSGLPDVLCPVLNFIDSPSFYDDG